MNKTTKILILFFLILSACETLKPEAMSTPELAAEPAEAYRSILPALQEQGYVFRTIFLP